MDIKINILNRISLASAIVFFAIGLAQCIYWSRWFGTTDIGCLIHLLPSVAFFATYVLGSKKNRNRELYAVAVLFSILTVFIWAFITIVVDYFKAATCEVTSVSMYEEILNNRWIGEEKLVEHFPSSIPSDAKGVRFAFCPPFLQGGAYIQLRYEAEPDEISKLYDQFSAKKTRSFMGGDKNIHMNSEEGMATTYFYTSGSEDKKFPKDYEIMVFDQQPEERDRKQGISWNHARCHGVAISKKQNEIVYWAERW